MVSNRVLKELCYVAQLDFWKEEDFPGSYENNSMAQRNKVINRETLNVLFWCVFSPRIIKMQTLTM